MNKLTLSALITASFALSACDQAADTPETMNRSSNTIIEETMEVAPQATEMVADEAAKLNIDTTSTETVIAEPVAEMTSDEQPLTSTADEMVEQTTDATEQVSDDLMAKAKAIVEQQMGEQSTDDMQATATEMVSEQTTDLPDASQLDTTATMSDDDMMDKAADVVDQTTTMDVDAEQDKLKAAADSLMP
ncbi:hypothetical protein A9Q78_03910 [Methylophaga sp. 41_12_T18]|nr:hypothetical protein A9Q78_03910 [Methylophaga sp. 41_12_T18]